MNRVNELQGGPDVHLRLRWERNNLCVGDYKASGFYKWFHRSGWGLKDNNRKVPKSVECASKVSVSANAHFKNGAFCELRDVHAYYRPATITGKKDGSVALSGKHWLTGPSFGCTDLLSFHTKLWPVSNIEEL